MNLSPLLIGKNNYRVAEASAKPEMLGKRERERALSGNYFLSDKT
jgi:hypothetical protein